jgi:hypothetical protein
MIKTIYKRSKFSSLSLFCAILILFSGCATTNPYSFSSPVPEEVRKQIRHILIVPAAFEPQIDYHPTVARGLDVGAAKGTAGGAAAGAIGGIKLALSPGGGGIGVLLLPFFVAGGVVIGGTVGGIAGALKSVPEKKARQIEETVDNELVKLDVQGTMAEHVYKEGNDLTDYKFTILKGIGPGSQEETPDYRTLNLEGNNIILEVKVISLGFKGGKGSNPYISVYMKVNARAIDVTSGEEIYSDIWPYVSSEHSLSEWVENNGQLLHDEFEHCYQSLAENIIERIFLTYEFHVDSKWGGPQTCVLQPFYPEYKGIGFFSGGLKYPKVDSLQPTLKWESFPREKDIKGDKKGILNRIDSITYDLKIWREQDFIQDEPLYTKQNLKKAEHKIEITLEQSKKYFWTFRARFKLGDQYRVTKWAHSRIPWEPIEEDPCNLNYISTTHYYRFKTPSE